MSLLSGHDNNLTSFNLKPETERSKNREDFYFVNRFFLSFKQIGATKY